MARVLGALALLVALGSVAYTAAETDSGAAPESTTVVEAAPAAEATSETTLLLTVEYLSEATVASDPFDTQLAVAFELVEDEPDMLVLLDELIAISENGVPNRADLQRQFRDHLIASRAPMRQRLLDNMTSGLNSIFVVNEDVQRRDQLLERMSALVAAGEIAAAVDVLREQGSGGLGLSDWMRQAEDRMKLDQMMSEIRKTAYLSILQEN